MNSDHFETIKMGVSPISFLLLLTTGVAGAVECSDHRSCSALPPTFTNIIAGRCVLAPNSTNAFVESGKGRTFIIKDISCGSRGGVFACAERFLSADSCLVGD